MKHGVVLVLAVALAVPAGALSVPGPTLVPPVGVDQAPQEALRLAALARGVPDAVNVDPVAELGAGNLDLSSALQTFFDVAVGAQLEPSEFQATIEKLQELSPEWQTAIADILVATATARELRDQAFAKLSLYEIRFAYEIGMRSIFAPETIDPLDALLALEILNDIDMAKMIHAAALLQATVARNLPSMQAPADGGPTEPITTSFGALAIGTDGTEVWEDDWQVLIDPGGDDTYLNNAGGVLNRQVFDTTGGCAFGGGTTGKARPNLGCTPLPSQVCTYDMVDHLLGTDDDVPSEVPQSLPGHEDPAGPNGGQGNDGSCGSDERRKALFQDTANLNNDADSRGVALALDLDGSDTYTVPWVHFDPLFELVEFCYPGEQDKVNTNRDLFQGGNLAGISILWDTGDGNDIYRGRLNVQGSGHVGGVALQIADGTGDAIFWADRLSQGEGVAAAVGILVNTKEGDHTYLLDAPLVYRNEFRPNGRDCAQEGRAGQGQGGFLGVGILWTQHPNATAVYRTVVHETTNAHPFPAIVDPITGVPILVGGNDAQGSGESFPIVGTPGGLVIGTGILLDDTDGDASVCAGLPSGLPASGMLSGSTTSTGIDLSTMGVLDVGCGKFNLEEEFDPQGDLGGALQHLAGGAVGLRIVL